MRATRRTDVPLCETVTVVAVRDAARVRVVAGQLDLGRRALELELLDALDCGAGEERLVATRAAAR